MLPPSGWNGLKLSLGCVLNNMFLDNVIVHLQINLFFHIFQLINVIYHE